MMSLKRQSKATIITTIAVIILIVAICFAAMSFGGKSYLFASVLIIALIMIPSFVSFEGRAPKARELVLIAVMCALCVCARAAFIWLPDFKPMAAMVIVSGIALGAQPGFLIGAISLLVSNFLFGQGPWTLWQMLAFALAGLVFGALADAGVIQREKMGRTSKLLLALGAGLFVFCIMGPLLDTASLFIMVSEITLESAIAIYLAGIPINIMQAIATSITLFLVINPILKKLARVREKYGLTEPRNTSPS